MEFRHHPIIEDLKCNEDGTQILRNNEPLRIKDEPNGRLYVHIYDRRVTVIRIVCECWHGMPENLDMAARRHDEDAGDHYSNLYWGKQGMTLNQAKKRNYEKQPLKITEAEYREIEVFRKTGEIQKELKKRGHSKKAWQNAMIRYGKEG